MLRLNSVVSSNFDLLSLAEEIDEGGVVCFEFKTLRFNLLIRNHIIFMGNSDKKIKQKKVLRELSEIANRFFRIYSPNNLKDLSCTPAQFSSFEQELSKMNKKDQLLDFISNHWRSSECDIIKNK